MLLYSSQDLNAGCGGRKLRWRGIIMFKSVLMCFNPCFIVDRIENYMFKQSMFVFSVFMDISFYLKMLANPRLTKIKGTMGRGSN